jgi:hypothetical protein
MSDGFSATVVDTVSPALARLGDAAHTYTNLASHVSAASIQREMKRRVSRQDARATGATAEGIELEEMHNGRGYVVYTTPVRRDNKQKSKQVSRLNVDLWLEYGTRRGKPRSSDQRPRPFFWPAVELEVAAHERRIGQALDDAMRAEGLGS